jgi:serine/threonine-protein kinase
MAAAHGLGVVHGDLKPANILVTVDEVVKIVDFGMARRKTVLAPGADTILWTPDTAGAISGTPAYMSPEQARGQSATPASDVFSLGLILYELLTGNRARPEGGNLLELLHLIEQEKLTDRLDSISAPFHDILSCALAIDPYQRRISMAEIAGLLA